MRMRSPALETVAYSAPGASAYRSGAWACARLRVPSGLPCAAPYAARELQLPEGWLIFVDGEMYQILERNCTIGVTVPLEVLRAAQIATAESRT